MAATSAPGQQAECIEAALAASQEWQWKWQWSGYLVYGVDYDSGQRRQPGARPTVIPQE